MSALTLLPVPWAFAGDNGTPDNGARDDLRARDIERPQAIAPVDAGAAPMLVAESRMPVALNGRSDLLEPEAEFRTGDVKRRLYALPVPLHADELQTLRPEGWAGDITVRRKGGVSRPARNETEGPGPSCARFLLALVGRMKDFETALELSFQPWEQVRRKWGEDEQSQEPMMDILVRHARQHAARWPDIAERPRRVLNRRREMVPLGRVEELDTRCMEWLSRQPGTTIAQRAGGQQRILALSRYENLNTLENRVARDLFERTSAAARDYLGSADARRGGAGHTARYGLVDRYARECRRLAFGLADQGVTRPSGPIQPNFVLLQDSRYRHVWRAWQEIVKREQVFDDLWRWQRRAWAEFCRAACVVSLLERTDLVAASPIAFRPEHSRGEWLLHDDPLAIVVERDGGWIVEILRGDASDVGPGCAAFGASAWLRVSDLEGGFHRYLPVWAIHGAGEMPDLAALVASADRAIALNQAQAGSNSQLTRLTGGLILQSRIEPRAGIVETTGTCVHGIAFGPFGQGLTDGLARIGDALAGLIDRTLKGAAP